MRDGINDDESLPASEWPDYQHLTISQDGIAAVVTLNRPDVHNAFNERLIVELRDAFTHLSADDSIRAVVLRGAGRSFSAGADLNWMRFSLDATHD